MCLIVLSLSLMLLLLTPKGRVFGLKLILYGTVEDPLANNQHVNRETKTIETVDISLRQTG